VDCFFFDLVLRTSGAQHPCRSLTRSPPPPPNFVLLVLAICLPCFSNFPLELGGDWTPSFPHRVLFPAWESFPKPAKEQSWLIFLSTGPPSHFRGRPPHPIVSRMHESPFCAIFSQNHPPGFLYHSLPRTSFPFFGWPPSLTEPFHSHLGHGWRELASPGPPFPLCVYILLRAASFAVPLPRGSLNPARPLPNLKFVEFPQ